MNNYNRNSDNNRSYDRNIENSRKNQSNNTAGFNNNPYINNNANLNNNMQNNNRGLSNINNSDFLKGALIGAAATFLLTNKSAQETIFKAFGKGSELFQAGVEELKERYEDIQAQREQQEF